MPISRPRASVHIVLADDHALIRRELRRLLEAETGWLVCGEAENGEDAVRLCETLRPDVAVLDISMPMMNGLDAAKRIRKAAPAVATIIVSMHVSEALMTAAIDAGAGGYLLKSEAAENLVPAIRAMLQPDLMYFPRRNAES